MRVTWSDIIVIGIVGLLVGLFFAYVSRGIETPPEALILLATVQGSFLAIVISVFLLSLQVNASVFSPLTLEQFGRSRVLIGLILLYVTSIMIDLLYLMTLSDPFLTVPVNLNLSLGIPSAVATICFLALIPAQKEMANLVAPETVLRQTADSASSENLVQEPSIQDSPTRENIKPPERTPLLTIEQILVSSSNRDDEYSVRQSIYYMYDTISGFLESYVDKYGDHSNKSKNKNSSVEDVDIGRQCEYIFDHWERCVEIGTDGGKGRIDLLNASHLQLTKLLIQLDLSENIDDRLEELIHIHLEAFQLNYTESNLLDSYGILLSTALENEGTDVIEDILSSNLQICEELIGDTSDDREYIDFLSGERRDVIAKGLSATIRHIQIITEHAETDKKFVRRVSRNAINRIDIILIQLFDNIDRSKESDPDAQGIKQNILTQLRTSMIEAIPEIYENDHVVSRNLLIAAVEIAVYQNQEPRQFRDQLNQSTTNEPVVKLFEADKIGKTDPFLDLTEDQEKVNEFINKLETQMK